MLQSSPSWCCADFVVKKPYSTIVFYLGKLTCCEFMEQINPCVLKSPECSECILLQSNSSYIARGLHARGLKFKQDFCIVLKFTFLSAQKLKGWRKRQARKTFKNLINLRRISMIGDLPYLYFLLFSLFAFHTIFNVGIESHAQDWIPVGGLLFI